MGSFIHSLPVIWIMHPEVCDSGGLQALHSSVTIWVFPRILSAESGCPDFHQLWEKTESYFGSWALGNALHAVAPSSRPTGRAAGRHVCKSPCGDGWVALADGRVSSVQHAVSSHPAAVSRGSGLRSRLRAEAADKQCKLRAPRVLLKQG